MPLCLRKHPVSGLLPPYPTQALQITILRCFYVINFSSHMCDHAIYVIFSLLGLTSPCVMVSISIHAPENNILSSYGLGGEIEIHMHGHAVFHEPSIGLLSIPYLTCDYCVPIILL